MRRIIPVLLLVFTFASLKGQDLRLGYVNGRATIKTTSTGKWRPISNRDVGLSLGLMDSISVVSRAIYIDAYKKGKLQDSFQADTGDWTVKDIIDGRAYHTNRPQEETGESIKGDMDSYFFDLIVRGESTLSFHFGDHPSVRLINDSDSAIFYALLWLEGQSGWNMLESSSSSVLPAKASKIVFTRDSFVIGPPEGNGDVLWVVSDTPFEVQEAIKKISGKQNGLNYLVKHIIITE